MLTINTGGDIRVPVVAALRDCSFSNAPSRSGVRYHVATVDGYAGCSSSIYLITDDLGPAEDIPIAERCRRPGCREHWPGAKFRPSPRRPRQLPVGNSVQEFLERFRCTVCNAAPPRGYYMVTDEVWTAAGFQQKDNACVECLVRRLGRPLTSADFTPAPVNELAIAVLKEVERSQRPCSDCRSIHAPGQGCRARDDDGYW